MEPLLFFHYKKCGTCRKAKKFLQEHNIRIQERSIVEQPPSFEEMQQLVQLSGYSAKKFFNTSGKRYRELQLSRRLIQLSEVERLSLLASDGMLIKRPIVTDGKKVTVGFQEDMFMETWVKPNHASE